MTSGPQRNSTELPGESGRKRSTSSVTTPTLPDQPGLEAIDRRLHVEPAVRPIVILARIEQHVGRPGAVEQRGSAESPAICRGTRRWPVATAPGRCRRPPGSRRRRQPPPAASSIRRARAVPACRRLPARPARASRCRPRESCDPTCRAAVVAGAQADGDLADARQVKHVELAGQKAIALCSEASRNRRW